MQSDKEFSGAYVLLTTALVIAVITVYLVIAESVL